jgi:hypothetical protein
VGGRGGLPGITGGVDGRVGNTSVEYLEEGLVLQHKGSCYAGWDSLGEADDGGVGNDCAAIEADWGAEDDGCSSEELDGEVAEVEHLAW